MITKKLNIKILLISSLIAGLSLLIFWHHHQTKENYPIHTIYSYEEALHITHSTNKNTFVFFDVDDTLLSSPALNKNYFSWWFKLLFLLSHPTHLFMNWEKAYSLLWEQAHFTLTQPSVVQLIATLKKQGATVLGLTSMESGAYGIIKNMPEWRYSMLKNLGIEFSQHFLNTQFKNFPQYRSTYPLLYKGILCANQQNKGAVMLAFLEKLKITPSPIIAFDDDLRALQSVGKVCHKKKIACTLFWYRRKELMPETWNTRQAMQDLRLLLTN